jgi:predicted alpha/beta superfamily hydrolase
MTLRASALVIFGLAIAGDLLAQSAATAPPPDRVPPHQTFTIAARELGESRVINVYTPPGYDGITSTGCGVLYMPDGGIGEDFPHVANAIDSLIRLDRIRPVIVVGIENTERRRDLTGPTSVSSDSTIAPRVGGSAAFRRFIRDELIPEVRSRYRCTGETAIVGESLAGLFVVETFLTEPTLFDRYIALSPSLWWNGGALVDGAGRHAAEIGGLPRTLYLASADEPEIVAGTAALADTLRGRAPVGLTLLHVPRPDLQHGTIFRGAAPGAFAEVLR